MTGSFAKGHVGVAGDPSPCLSERYRGDGGAKFHQQRFEALDIFAAPRCSNPSTLETIGSMTMKGTKESVKLMKRLFAGSTAFLRPFHQDPWPKEAVAINCPSWVSDLPPRSILSHPQAKAQDRSLVRFR